MIVVQIFLIIAVLLDLAMLILVLKARHGHRALLPFAWYLAATIIWTIFTAVLQSRPERMYAEPLLRGAHATAAFGAISLIWFCTLFPRLNVSFRKIAIAFTLLGLPLLVLVWGDLIVRAAHYQPWVEVDAGPLMPYYTIWWSGCTGSALVQLIIASRHARGVERLQLWYVLFGSIGLVVTGGVLTLILPAITGDFRYAPYSPLGTLFFTVSTSYAILRFRLMDIRIVLRAGLIYSVTIGTLSLLFALLVPLLNNALAQLHFPYSTGSFIMAFLIALAFQPMRQYVQTHVDRVFFKNVYDYWATLHEAGHALASAHDHAVLVHTMLDALDRTLHPSGIAIYLPGYSRSLVRVTDLETSAHFPPSIDEGHPLISYVLETDDVLLAEELIRQPEPLCSYGRYLHDWDAYVLLPLIVSGRLCGIALLGDKLSGDVYSTDDISLQRILGKQTAVALDNAHHYHDIVMMNEYHARLLQIMQDGVIALDPDKRIITFNAAAERITGVPISEALGKSLDDIGLAQLALETTGEQGLEIQITTRERRVIPVLATITPFTRHQDITASSLLVFRDLSALRALEQEKMQAERFSSMGAMAASLAHEIKNPLVPIQLFAHLLPTRYDDQEFREDFSRTVLNEVERINRLIGQMLDLVRKPAEARISIDVSELIERLLVLTRPDCERNQIRVHCIMESPLAPVHGIAGQLYQALLNVVMNAVQVMPTGGDLTLTTRQIADKVAISITDTGPGVSPEELPRIFEPLYSTRTGGHGLGLALTYQFIRAHGGEIHADCQPPNGLTVTVLLPAFCSAENELVCS